jgi:hypothetical protein
MIEQILESYVTLNSTAIQTVFAFVVEYDREDTFDLPLPSVQLF